MLESRAKSLGLLSDTVWSYIDKVVAFHNGDDRLRKQLVDMHIAKRVASDSIDNVFNGYVWSKEDAYDDDCYRLTADQMAKLRYVGVSDVERVAFDSLNRHDDYVAVYRVYETDFNAKGEIVKQSLAKSATPIYMHKSQLVRFWLNDKYVKLENLYNRTCKAIDSGKTSLDNNVNED